MNDYEAVVKVC